MIHTLLYICSRICSDWIKFHLELVTVLDVLKGNSYPDNFINNYFKTFLNSKHEFKKKLWLCLRNLCFWSYLTLNHYHHKLEPNYGNILKGIRSCCKLQIMFKSQNKLSNGHIKYHIKDCIPKEVAFGVIYKSQCELCNDHIIWRMNAYNILM